MAELKLIYFKPAEFGEWWPLMNHDLLVKLDAFRGAWGYPVMVSPAEGGLGRRDGPEGASMHNVERWGEVRAVDVFLKVPIRTDCFAFIRRADDRRRAHELARQVGFKGIGLYTDTSPGNMLHVDNRDGDHIATWSRIDGKYQSIQKVIA